MAILGVCLTMAILLISPASCSLVKANLRIGSIVGTTMVSRLGRNFTSFRGIPYAKPPVGDLRFMAPVPPDPWDGVFNATLDAPMCLQKNYFTPALGIGGSEDCLYLNVYTPMLPRARRRRHHTCCCRFLPCPCTVARRRYQAQYVSCRRRRRLRMDATAGLDVMVYIHGGGWFAGTGASYIEGPQYLMDKDIVLVTVNYRLGPLGFLSTGDSNALGNYAMKDLVMSLEWVRDNIAGFGGNPNSVTIFGQSAGAGNVHFLLLSPMARGLFHKAIAQSGSALDAWAFVQDPLPVAKAHGAAVGCVLNGTDTAALVSCLRGVDGHKLVDTTDAVHFWSIDPLTAYRPVIELTGDRPFLSRDPFDIVRSGDFAKIPWLTGVVGNEGIVRAVSILTNETLVQDLNANLDTLMPSLMDLQSSVVNSSIDAVWQQIKSFYLSPPGGGPAVIGDSSAEGFINLYGDRSFYHGMQNAITYHTAAGHTDLYVYSFEYRGMYTYTSIFANTTKDYGVSHCDDLLYLFFCPILFPPYPEGHPDLKMIETLTTLWTNFAKYGNPTPPPPAIVHRGKRHIVPCLNERLESSLLSTLYLSRPIQKSTDEENVCTGNLSEIQWTPVSAGQPIPYLRIGKANDSSPEFCMKTNLLENRMFFWNSLPLRENQYAHEANVHDIVYVMLWPIRYPFRNYWK